MLNMRCDDLRRDPFPSYARARSASPLLSDPASGLWMAFDYETVRHVLTDHDAFSSKHGPDWLIFTDPPRHTDLRAHVSRAFTPRSIAALEPRIRDLSRELLDTAMADGRTEFDLAADYAVPLPMLVIAEMLGVPAADRPRFKRWVDVLLYMSYTIGEAPGADDARRQFVQIAGEMGEYITATLKHRRGEPRDDLLTRLAQAEVNGQRLTPAEILGFFQLLLLAGSETTTNLISNAILCFTEFPDQLARLRAHPELLPSAIEEVLRFRSPVQWLYRVARRDIEVNGQTIPAGKMILAMIGSANRDERVFPRADAFDITRDPNPHLAFGHGQHFCLGAPLAHLEARIAFSDLLARMPEIQLASKEPWTPRRGLHVHGPEKLPIRFTRA